ncbi:phospholipid carrier-dependent glycosyltransferase [Croceibacterium ferulae]|uniref:phospholipid carrier-dependent glycosyltransferase n=1 Tax=Croceibacterium ferulae TaxID=1854641 RepID=UPI000EACAB11|nr:phospholipid carrier-dependent glycosyltransferase [Croceibacterium ferulae]
MRSQPPARPRDPLGWTALLVALFALLAGWRLTTPSQPFFDEVHYLPAARALLDLSRIANPEHPPLGKLLIAGGMAVFGDNALGWRVMPWAAGVLTLWAFTRALWFASLSRFASLTGGVLAAAGFPLLVQTRIAMLDVFMLAGVICALWMCAGAIRQPETGRRRMALAGVALGCAMAAKWNAIPVAVLPGLAFAAVRLRACGWHGFTTRRGPPVPGIRLAEAALWLGLVPLLVYAACFLPYWFVEVGALRGWGGLVEQHRHMLALQHQTLPPHPYQSRWWEWVGDWRGIWYLYEPVDGAQRGVLLVGNPLVHLPALAALGWCLWAGVRGRADALAVAVLYGASMALWVVTEKNVQFFYHYALPGLFATAALALALDTLWQRGWRVVLAVPAGAVALLAWFWPVLTAAALDGVNGYRWYAWVDGWL